ncbi:Crp/Fnr family transcriptional regulator [Bacteriovorax sp. DB6_IX]|uniref:Crp/Fnr family transcriptional regulator n=1 Tax=Bacteriovorax sp. DB6_IX TaxID=1353530 RepID=UPI00038A2CDB|nr:cyclic nucleotide-binding domain-containing protein [Bacteriovorax sp. DB6_IX]EQC52694.1 cyclic nucleotide-binding domain protein [Bacteriovorax sp. DB6_IX]
MPNSSKTIFLKPNEMLFRENEPAENLYIIKSGMIRIFRPKGKGYIELAVLHQGELVGEMALFENNKNRRNASAEAIVSTELYEVSFDAFKNAYDKLNPWFQTILNTLTSRLNIQNTKVKAFESNSVSMDYNELRAGGVYNFFKEIEVIRLFSVFYMAFKCQADQQGNESTIHESTLDLFSHDIFSFSEVKIKEFIKILENLNLIQRKPDKEGQLKLIYTNDVEIFKKAIIFLNKERHLQDDKKLHVSENCIHLLDGIRKKHEAVPYPTLHPTVNIQGIIDELRKEKINISQSDYVGAIKGNFIDEPYFNNENKAVCGVDLNRVMSLLPMVKILTAFENFNQDKRLK